MSSSEIMQKHKLSIYNIVSYLSIIAAVICILIYFISSKVGWNVDEIDTLLSLLASISLFIISTAKKTDETNDKINHIFNDVIVLKEGTPAIITDIDNEIDFYCLLNEKVTKSTNRVWLMHLDPWAPTSPQCINGERKSYFGSVLQYAKDHPNVDFRRIISIPNESKLRWVEALIKDASDIQNLNLAYIKTDDIEDLFPTSVTSCQIIDNDKMFLLNPLLNHVPRARGLFKKCLYIENKKIVNIYVEYYEKLWNEITKKNSQYGCTLKNESGTEIFYKNIDRIKNDINNRGN